ncbi:MAG: mechanosensitive ion channel family protein [Pyrinomonadaceae bacterium]|nr:mechanosensitive ion channel family protein [Pyrinomonadaceae bacterium]
MIFQNTNSQVQVVRQAHEVKDVLWTSIDGMWTTLIERLPYLIAGLLLLGLFYLLGRLARQVIWTASKRTNIDRRLRVLYMRLSFIVIFVFGVLTSLTVIVPSLEFKDVIAGLGFTSFVIGFATRDILNNLFSGLLILWREPFKWNDHIQIGGNHGRVETIGVRATELRKDDGELILIPNGEMYSSTLTIHKAGEKRRLAMMMSFKFDNDIRSIKRLIADAIVEVTGILDDPRPSVLVSEVSGENITLTVNFWIDTDEHRPLEVFDEAAMAAIDALRQAGIMPSSVAASVDQVAKETSKPKRKFETEI